ncbi:serine/threonine-protein kinase [Streptomyces sp. NPDC056632]|uniref:serine/threonine-protein kinase n=1 Tax=Streptomyces sp. NPDC056632 TaxID=3345884 RepID=UPI0036C3652A
MTARILPVLPGDPARVGPYRIVGRLGAGGMGTVYAALDSSGDRLAVKVVHPAQAGDEEFRSRFRREVALTSRVSGPCLVPVVAADCEAERPWLATPYIPGPTLQQHIAAHGPLHGAVLHALAAGTATALASVHEAGVIHRDIKPGNVILSPSGPRLLDFGIAHAFDGTSVTRTGMLTGTPGWISPEQYRTGSVGPESDVFAWGALVAYAGTGRHPFGTGAPDTVAFRVMSQDPDLAGLPEDLALLVADAMSKEASDRPTAKSLGDACGGLLAKESTQVLPQDDSTPVLVDGLVSDHWSLPPADEDTWPTSRAGRAHGRVRKVSYIAAAAAAVLGIAATAVYASTALGRQAPSTAAAPALPPASPSVSSSSAAAPTTPPSSSALPASTASTVTAVSSPTVTTPKPAATTPTAEPQPAYTRSDYAEPTIGEWSAARDAMTASERDIAASINEELKVFLRDEWALPEGVQVTFNPEAQTMFLTAGPSTAVWENGGDYTDLHRSMMYTGCTHGNDKLRTDITWPYGRVVVVYRESMANPVIASFREVTNGMHCRV